MLLHDPTISRECRVRLQSVETASRYRRVALDAVTAVIGCAMLVGAVHPAAARMIDDPALRAQTASGAATADAHSVQAREGSDETLAVALAGALVLGSVATVGYARRGRTSRRRVA
jgi:hypothetical protein